MLRARALEQALRKLINAAVQTASKIAEDGDRRWHVVDLVCATNDAEKVLAVDPPPSGASPQADTRAQWEGGKWSASVALSNGFTTEDYRTAPSGHGPHAYTWRDKPHRLLYDLCAELERRKPAPVSPVEPEPPATCRCLDCEPLTDPGPTPSEDDINRLEKAAWDSKTDRVLVWYRDRAAMFRQRLRETERAWQLDRKKPTVAEPCVWRPDGAEIYWTTCDHFSVRPSRSWSHCHYCGAPLKVEREQPAEIPAVPHKPVPNLMEALKKSLDSLDSARKR